jgi:hypothetical protein
VTEVFQNPRVLVTEAPWIGAAALDMRRPLPDPEDVPAGFGLEPQAIEAAPAGYVPNGVVEERVEPVAGPPAYTAAPNVQAAPIVHAPFAPGSGVLQRRPPVHPGGHGVRPPVPPNGHQAAQIASGATATRPGSGRNRQPSGGRGRRVRASEDHPGFGDMLGDRTAREWNRDMEPRKLGGGIGDVTWWE